MENAKALIKSTTFQIAVLQAILGALAIFETAYPAVGILAIAKSIIDIALRLKTSQPIGSVL